MNVLHVTRDLLPRSVGGISGVVGGLLDECANAGIGARAVSFDAWRPNVQRATGGKALVTRNVLRLDGPGALDEAYAFARSSGAEVVHIHHESLWEHGRAFANELGARTVYTAHVLQWELNTFRGIGETRSSAGQAIALTEADVVTAPSQSAAESVRALSGREALVTYPGLATPWFENAAVRRNEARPRLVCVGRWDVAKGTDRVLEAARHAAAEFGPLTLALLGGVPENAKAARRWNETFARVANESLQIETPGWLGSLELRDELDRATLMVQLSASETFGIAMVEALARGLPVIASPRGVIAELAPDTFRAVAHDDVSEATRAIVDLLGNDELRHRYTTRARVAAEAFAWSRVLPGWVAAWETATR